MGRMISFGKYLVISSANKIFVFNSSTSSIQTLKVCDLAPDREGGENGAETNEGDFIVSLVVSKCSEYLAAATHSKKLVIWKISNKFSDSPSWKLIKIVNLIKRSMAIAFIPDASKIVIADKTGDVHSFWVNDDDQRNDDCFHEKIATSFTSIEEYFEEEEPGPEPLLGHLSMLLDLIVTDDGKFLITCDRDEKIRVSSYPNCYNIHTFCLGHEEFVSQVVQIPNKDGHLLSASGDGTVRLWNYLSGSSLAVLDTKQLVKTLQQHSKTIIETVDEDFSTRNMPRNGNFSAVTKLAIFLVSETETFLAIAIHRLPYVILYKIRDSSFSHLTSFPTTFIPKDFTFLEAGDLLIVAEDNGIEIENSFLMLKLSANKCDLVQVEKHPMLWFGNMYHTKLKAQTVSLPIDSLYKQKYDNVSDYKKKKAERLSQENGQARKKGRWIK